MSPEQMKRLAEAAQLLRQAKAIIEAARNAADEEQISLPERLQRTEIEDAAETAALALSDASRHIEDALENVAEVTGEDDSPP